MGFLVKYPGPDSNRHGIAANGFKSAPLSSRNMLFVELYRTFYGVSSIITTWHELVPNEIFLRAQKYYQDIITSPLPCLPVIVPPSGFGIDAFPAIVEPLETPPI